MTELKNQSSFSTLSDLRILSHIKSANIVISPFRKENLGTASYDVTLGEYYYREQVPQTGHGLYSPWSEKDVKRVWGSPQRAVFAKDYFAQIGMSIPDGIFPKDKVIVIPPQQTFLCHTIEFIGGKNTVTTMMKARSSLGRNFIEVCKCAGWGDVGYVNRWTMEITNNSSHYAIPLVVGRRIAQIVFFEVGEILGKDYTVLGKYQTNDNLKKLQKEWEPSAMIPKMWKDREINKK